VWFNPNSSNPPTPNAANGTTVYVLDPPASLAMPTDCQQPCVLNLAQSTRSGLYRMNGQLVTETAGKFMSINGHPTGIYLLNVEAETGSTTQKIILR
jgi:hypothetical protein